MDLIHSFIFFLFFFSNKGCRTLNGYDSCEYVESYKVISANIVSVTLKTSKTILVHLDYVGLPENSLSFRNVSKSYLEYILRNYGSISIRVMLRSYGNNTNEKRGILYSGKINVNKKMLSEGYACALAECSKSYKTYMNRAQYKKIVLWSIKSSFNSKCRENFMNFDGNINSNSNNNENIDDNANGSQLNNGMRVVIQRVVDGDTVYVGKDNSFNPVIKVRMSYIDAPETRQPYGQESKQHLAQMISRFNSPNNVFRLVGSEKDRYGRTLAVLWANDVDINEKMVADGFAWCYRYTRCPTEYQELARKAEDNGKGLFNDSNPETPWDWRKRMKSSKSGDL